VKNTLATVQALANQTFRDGGPPATARAAFNARLQIVYHSDGVVCTMRGRLQRLQQDISPMAAP
jgi:HWE histidine kinase